MNFIINYLSKYEKKGYADRADYFMDRMIPDTDSTKNGSQMYSESQVKDIIIEHLSRDKGYPLSTIKADYKLYTLNYGPDIALVENNVILAIIEIKKSKFSNILTHLTTYYNTIIENQERKPKLFTVFYEDSFYTFYEYSMTNKRIGERIEFPEYHKLLSKYTDTNKISSKSIWDDFIKTLNVDKLSNVKKGIEDDNFKEAIKVRDFLKRYDKHLRKKIPFLTHFNSKLNSHPNQPHWTQDNGFRYSYYINDKYLHGIQLNITIWASWKGGIFIKDNENIIFNDKKLLNKLTNKYKDLEFRETYKDIFAKHFNDGISDEATLLKSLNLLINLLKDVDIEKNIFKDITEDETAQDFEKIVYDENRGLTIASQNNDTPKGEDSLDIASDVNALSKLIAYKQLQPPLSIGLFGEWGSGKSFFMHEIHKKVDSLSNSNHNIFYQNIVHIEFNAWHYSDSNLWASLVSKIFNTLNDEIKGTENQNSLFEKLQFIQDRKKEIKSEQKKIEDEITANEKKLERLEKDKLDELIEIKNITISSITQTVFNDDEIKTEVAALKNELKEVGVINENDINSLTSLVSDISTLQGTVRRFFNVFAKDNSFVYWMVGLSLFGLITVFGVSHYFEKEYFLQIVTTLLACTLPILTKLSFFIKKLKDFSPTINQFLDNYEKKKQDALKAYNKQSIEKQDELEKLEKNINQLQLELSSSTEKMKKLNNEMNDIRSGKYLADFISERSDDYNSRLGLISIIRDDFEKLSSYLKNETDEIAIDRIILYIDDLDRCTNNLVIEVLEAIHLLLAFDLFVVIVGVDIRWISNSLNVKYENLDTSNSQKATPLEYLEKIFQIPFHLQKITNNNKKVFIEKLLSQNIEKKVVEKAVEQLEVIYDDETVTFDGENVTFNDSIDEETLNTNEDNENENDLEHQHLEVSMEELNYMKDLSSLISSSPRNIKRFINIYMIIRSHEKVHNYQDPKHYQAIIFLLTVVFTNPQSLLSVNNQDSLNNLISNIDLSEINDETKNSINSLQFNVVEEHLRFLLRFSFRT